MTNFRPLNVLGLQLDDSGNHWLPWIFGKSREFRSCAPEEQENQITNHLSSFLLQDVRLQLFA